MGLGAESLGMGDNGEGPVVLPFPLLHLSGSLPLEERILTGILGA